MAALTADRSTLRIDGVFRSLPVEAGKLVFAGALAMINAAGNVVPGTSALGLTAVGRAEARADNTLGGAGSINVQVRRGVFCFNNSTGADAISNANIGTTVYAVDDQTVALTNGTNTRSPVGTVHHVDADGVWVEIK